MADRRRTELEEISLSEIVQDDHYQVRQSLDKGTVQQYANAIRAGATMPPVKIANVEGVLILVDGFHRVAAMQRLGRGVVLAEVVHATTKQEARWLAGEANLTHGLRLKSREVREVFRAYVKAKQHRDGKGYKGYRKISEELSGRIHYTTARAWMVADFPREAASMAKLEGSGSGGLRDKRRQSWVASAKLNLNNAKAMFEGIKDPKDRGEVIAHAEAVLRAMRGESNIESHDF